MPIASAVREQIKQLPSKHLGYVEYVEHPSTANYRALFINLTPQEEEYVERMLRGSAPDSAPEPEMAQFNLCDAAVPVAVPLLPDFVCNHLNCTIDVRIPRYELYDNENVYERRVWGTDVYTDDSDVVAILYHCGILLSMDPLAQDGANTKSTDRETNGNGNVALSPPPSSSTSPEPRYPVQPDSPAEDISDMLVVRLRILPPLTAYHGRYRHCYNSRSWDGPVLHDGASVSVDSVRWCRKCNRGPGQRRLR